MDMVVCVLWVFSLFFFFFFQIVCWAPLSSHSINQCVMSCVAVRGIILQFGSGCRLTNGPSVVKIIWREQKVGSHGSFTSNIHQQFHLSLLSSYYLCWCCVCFVFSGNGLLWFLGKNKNHQSLVRKLSQIVGKSEVCWSTAWAVSNCSVFLLLQEIFSDYSVLENNETFARLICLYGR